MENSVKSMLKEAAKKNSIGEGGRAVAQQTANISSRGITP